MPYRDPLRIALQQPRIPLVLLTHPFELALGAVLIINGLRGFAGDISPSLATLPQWLQVVYLAVSTVGGTGVVTGLLARVPRLRLAQPRIVFSWHRAARPGPHPAGAHADRDRDEVGHGERSPKLPHA